MKTRKRKRADIVRSCQAIIIGTSLAFLTSLLRPLLEPKLLSLGSYFDALRPPHALLEALVLIVMLTIIFFVAIAGRFWRSIKSGLIPSLFWAWVLLTAVFWVMLDLRHPRTAAGGAGTAGLLILGAWVARRNRGTMSANDVKLIELDLPVPEGGTDLLGRQEIISTLVSTILIDEPIIIAVTGSFGDGKTSVLNMAIGEIVKRKEAEQPIIVKFSPWLAADSNTLILSLLNSIVAEINHRYAVPGLKRDAGEYARTLLKLVPKAGHLDELFVKRSQEELISVLATRINTTGRRIVVVLDDLDRMEAAELETILKILRGSDKFTSLTFVCSFGTEELKALLASTRAPQDIDKFMEKFFQCVIPLPKVSSTRLREFFSQKLDALLEHYQLPQLSMKAVTEFWDVSGESYFVNLRRVKLFLNRVNHSLKRIGTEVNICDFLRLELLRDVAPSIYEEIYRSPEYFYNRELVFEVEYRRLQTIDKNKAQEARARFYGPLLESLPKNRSYVADILGRLFPNFASYQGHIFDQTFKLDAAEAQKRLFHPRCFRQYFLLRVPDELFSERDFTTFLADIKEKEEGGVIESFNGIFRALGAEEFKRWHFMHRIEGSFEGLRAGIQRALCRAMAQNSAPWPSDAFELFIAVRCTRDALSGFAESAQKSNFLTQLIRDAVSDLYAVILPQVLQKEGSEPMQEYLLAARMELQHRFHETYLGNDLPSVFERFGGGDQNPFRIDPNQFLFSWQELGPEARIDQRRYLERLFARHPEDIDNFLRLMFRVEFMDDFTALKPLIDYNELSLLITRNEIVLDAERVRKFRERWACEQAPSV
jgi:hypothetical protein